MARVDAPLARRNPVAKVGAGFLFSLALLATLDPVTPALAVAIELALVPLFGVRYRELARRAGPVLLAAAGVLLSLVLFSTDRSGTTLTHLGPFAVTTGVLHSALALGLRLVAVAIPAVLVFGTTDPTDLADALVQNVKAPARFAIGTLAALRLVPLLGQEWRLLALARRARGVDAGANPVAHLRLFASTTFALLVGAIRRGTRLATAMDARGFDSQVRRTVARPQRFGPADAALVVAAAAVGAALIVASVALGTFTPLLA
ncbi:MAG: energy-coupling factor transporter transmembrane component T family protein [Micromonosporaceae bacterium]